jgi:hypothetical protein
VWDSANRTIQHRADVRGAVSRAFADIYLWNATVWLKQLKAGGWTSAAAGMIKYQKSSFFWEELAGQLAQRVLGVMNETERLFLFGPNCSTPSGQFKCTPDGVAAAARVAVKTSVDASRDDLMPVSRSIFLFAQRPFVVTNVMYKVGISSGVHVASPWREFLDIRCVRSRPLPAPNKPPSFLEFCRYICLLNLTRVVQTRGSSPGATTSSPCLLVHNKKWCSHGKRGDEGACDLLILPRQILFHVGRPIIGGDKLNRTVSVLADSPIGRSFFPDYNLIFIPLRHLVHV